MRFLIVLFIVSLTQISWGQFCSSDQRFTEVEVFSLSEIDSISDQPYGTAVDYNGVPTTLYFDVFYPNNTIDTLALRPAVVLIHGGSFSVGQKEDRHAECLELAKRGYVAFTISYRLGWDTNNPIDQFLATYRAHQDAHAAIRHFVHHSSSFRIDPNWIFAGGSSAGAVTANNLVYSSQSEYEAAYPGISTLLGNLYTSTNTLTETFDIKAVLNNWGSVPTNNVQTNEMVPQIAFHGELDTTVDIDTSATGFMIGSRGIHNLLVANNTCADLTVSPNGGHGIYVSAIGTRFRMERTSCFFKSIFCNACADFYSTSPVTANCSTILNHAKLEQQASWTVYPNPFQNSIDIINLQGNEQFRLYNSAGQELFNGNTIPNTVISTLPAGFYLLTIENSTAIKQFKLVKH